MLIRSKNKMHLVNIENGVVSAKGEGTVTFRAGKIRNVLGEYSSLKTALRVLDMIEEAYADEKSNKIYTRFTGKRVQKHDKRSITVSPSRNLGESCFPDAGRK